MTQIFGTLISIFLLIGVGLIVRWRNILPREQTVGVFNAAVVIIASGLLAAQIARALRLRRPTAGALVIYQYVRLNRLFW